MLLQLVELLAMVEMVCLLVELEKITHQHMLMLAVLEAVAFLVLAVMLMGLVDKLWAAQVVQVAAVAVVVLTAAPLLVVLVVF
jgi:hypothetical protein